MGGGGPQHTTATTTTSNLPEYAEPYYTAMIQRGQGESTRPYQAYPGQRLSDTATETEAGFDLATLYGGSAPSYAQAGAGMAADAGLTALLANNYDPLNVTNQYAGPTLGAFNPGTFDPGLVEGAFAGPSGYAPGTFSAGSAGAPSASGGTVQASFDPTTFSYRNVNSTYTGPTQGTYDPGVIDAQQIGTDQFTADVRDHYMSPYMDAVVARGQEDAARSYQIEEAMRNLDAAASGAFGGSRYAVQQQLGRSDLQNRLSDIFTQGQQSAFENAQMQFERDQLRQLDADKSNQSSDLRAQELTEAARQFGYKTSEEFYRDAARMGLDASLANQQADLESQRLGDLSRQFGSNLGYMASRDTAANQTQADIASMRAALEASIANQQAGLEAQRMGEASRQFGYSQDLGASMEAGRQALQQGGMNQDALLEAQRLGEQSRQFGYQGGLTLENLTRDAGQMDLEAQRANQAADLEGLRAGLEGTNIALGASNQLTQSQGAIDQAVQDRIRSMLGVGQAREDIEQQQLDMAYEDFINQRDVERQNLQFLSSLLQGVPISANQNVVTSEPTNPLAGLLGSASGLQALYALGQQ